VVRHLGRAAETGSCTEPAVTRRLVSLQIECELLCEPYLLVKWFFGDLGSETTFLVRRLHGRKADTTSLADGELEVVERQAIALSNTMMYLR
jgi:hypothetical protein